MRGALPLAILAKSMVGGARVALGKSAKGFEPIGKKDTQPLVQLGELNP
jgi:hypothetical protein